MATKTIGPQPMTVDLRLYEGDDFWFDVTVTNPDGSPFDLTGYTPRAQIRTSTESEEVIVEFEVTVTTNVIHLHLASPVTTDLVPTGVWDLQIETGGAVTTLMAGRVNVTPEVTR